MSEEKRLVFILRDGPDAVDGSAFSDADLASVSSDTAFLSLENADISDCGIYCGISSLPDLDRLRCIDPDGTRITDVAMHRIAQFRQLEEIWIEDTAVSDVGIVALHSLRHLRFISVLDCAGISDQAVAALERAIPGVEVH